MPQSYRILIVDDNKARAETLSTFLENGQGAFQVMHSWSIDAGIETLCAVPVDALLLQGTCLTDGFSHVKQIRDHFESLVIIVVVSKETEAIGKEFFRVGACGYILEEETRRHSAQGNHQTGNETEARKNDGAFIISMIPRRW